MLQLLDEGRARALVLFVTCGLIGLIPDVQASTTVAVIDSGVDTNHVELNGKLLPGFDLTAGNDPNADNVGHGTAMASLIAGHQLGACFDCRILPLKVT